MKKFVAIFIAALIYLTVMIALVVWCGHLTERYFGCFKTFDGIGSVAGGLLILPLYHVVNRILGFWMK